VANLVNHMKYLQSLVERSVLRLKGKNDPNPYHTFILRDVSRHGCGNSVHIRCMKVWAEHQLKSTGQATVECPFCRENFGPLASLQAELRGATLAATRRPEHLGVVCHECHATPIVGKCYKWVDSCSTFINWMLV